MTIIDRVYGEFEITEPVLLDLINSPSMQRLKRVGQHGMPQRYYPRIPTFSRYEHSVGVMLALRLVDASIAEQAAGLLHDVSHTAFSHVADVVFGDPSIEDYQDSQHESVIRNSEIPSILEKYGLDVETIVEYERYPLLERHLPQICADRLDYGLREMKDWAAPSSVGLCVDSLTVLQDEIGFTSVEAAQGFADGFMTCQRQHWSSPDSRMRYALLGEVLKKALLENLITVEDFSLDDETILAKLEESNIDEIRHSLDLLRNDLSDEYQNLGRTQPKKLRYVDPLCLVDGKPIRLSSANHEYWLMLEEYQLNFVSV